jgi:hypothetical protein
LSIYLERTFILVFAFPDGFIHPDVVSRSLKKRRGRFIDAPPSFGGTFRLFGGAVYTPSCLDVFLFLRVLEMYNVFMTRALLYLALSKTLQINPAFPSWRGNSNTLPFRCNATRDDFSWKPLTTNKQIRNASFPASIGAGEWEWPGWNTR